MDKKMDKLEECPECERKIDCIEIDYQATFNEIKGRGFVLSGLGILDNVVYCGYCGAILPKNGLEQLDIPHIRVSQVGIET